MKAKRQAKILEIIRKNEVGTQEELTQRLLDAGYPVTQATVSRDIRELKLTKIPIANGRQRYTSMKEVDAGYENRYINVFREGVVSMDTAQNILVIKTVAGMAMAVAASLDAFGCDEIVGSIAGDDTIMCAVRTVDDTAALLKRFNKIIRD